MYDPPQNSLLLASEREKGDKILLENVSLLKVKISVTTKHYIVDWVKKLRCDGFYLFCRVCLGSGCVSVPTGGAR